jgi:hypothetical protein
VERLEKVAMAPGGPRRSAEIRVHARNGGFRASYGQMVSNGPMVTWFCDVKVEVEYKNLELASLCTLRLLREPRISRVCTDA